MRVLVTGGRGFVGQAVCRALRGQGHRVRTTARDRGVDGAPPVVVPDIGPDTDWDRALADVEAVVHLAAHVHAGGRETPALAAEHRRVNAEGTARLARESAARGIGRFLFMSSVKVHGERTPGEPFRETDALAPEDAYGRSKRQAEESLQAVAAETAMRAVVLRPPLVYGPGVGGNMLRLLRLCRRGLPLPLGAATGRRSLIHVDSLASAVGLALAHSDARGPYLVRDGEDLSVAALVRRLRRALGVPARLVPVPPALIRAAAACLGAGPAAGRLLDELRVDDARIRRCLGWTPPLSVGEGLEDMAAWFRAQS